MNGGKREERTGACEGQKWIKVEGPKKANRMERRKSQEGEQKSFKCAVSEEKQSKHTS